MTRRRTQPTARRRSAAESGWRRAAAAARRHAGSRATRSSARPSPLRGPGGGWPSRCPSQRACRAPPPARPRAAERTAARQSRGAHRAGARGASRCPPGTAGSTPPRAPRGRLARRARVGGPARGAGHGERRHGRVCERVRLRRRHPHRHLCREARRALGGHGCPLQLLRLLKLLRLLLHLLRLLRVRGLGLRGLRVHPLRGLRLHRRPVRRQPVAVRRRRRRRLLAHAHHTKLLKRHRARAVQVDRAVHRVELRALGRGRPRLVVPRHRPAKVRARDYAVRVDVELGKVVARQLDLVRRERAEVAREGAVGLNGQRGVEAGALGRRLPADRAALRLRARARAATAAGARRRRATHQVAQPQPRSREGERRLPLAVGVGPRAVVEVALSVRVRHDSKKFQY
eukprot:6142277-Prymnesium_polylepis.1